MRVCHVITGLKIGGAEMMLLKLANELHRRSISQCVVSLMDKGELGKEFEALAIPVHCLNMAQGRMSWPALWRLSKIIENYQPDVIQGWMYHANLSASIAVRRKVPVVWGVRQSLYSMEREKWSTRLVIALGRVLARYCERIIYNSITSARQHEERGYPANKRIVIGNGFELERFRVDPGARSQIRRELGFRDMDFLLGNVARFDPLKDHVGLIEAFSRVARQHQNAHLIMAGSGVDKSNRVLTNKIKDAGLHEQVHLLGLRTDVAHLMNSFDIYVSSSSGEGFPNVVGEAMACGIPCIVTDVGESRAIVGDAGWVVRPGNTSELTHAIKTAIGLPSHLREKLGERARKHIGRVYSIASISDAYENLYRDVGRTRKLQRASGDAT